jgi:hypothetical protein
VPVSNHLTVYNNPEDGRIQFNRHLAVRSLRLEVFENRVLRRIGDAGSDRRIEGFQNRLLSSTGDAGS